MCVCVRESICRPKLFYLTKKKPRQFENADIPQIFFMDELQVCRFIDFY
jgi:hypothetical protein